MGHDELFAVVRDKYPVAPGHALIVARRPVHWFGELSEDEQNRLMRWVKWTQHFLITEMKPEPEGFNLGVNDGPAAGQTIPQFHFHVIPRRIGDVSDPRGGVRWVMPAKAKYWSSE